jgi:Cu(I)/Ag(I) efflux system membrane fusion protein
MSFIGPGFRSPTRHSAWLTVRVLLVRLRFFLVLAAVLLLVGYWHVLRSYWERLTRSPAIVPGAISRDTEYWCPMCPGVVSDWPSKCPVCNMALVRRKKGEATPLPDGVLARMQFSPYQVQLAGIRTAEVEYRSLRREVVLVGAVDRVGSASTVSVPAEVFASDLPFVSEGQRIEADADSLPGHPHFQGKIARIEGCKVRMAIDDPDHELPAGTLVTAHAEAAIMRLPWWQRALAEEWRNRTAVDLAQHALLAPALPSVSGGVQSLLYEAGTQAMLAEGQGLAVPCSAVIDHGARKVVFVENSPGMFDAVEIAVGPRCGDFYPVLRGVAASRRLAATGAFLLDAEMWLNHGLAATYFGATRGATEPKPAAPSVTPGSLSLDDGQLAAKQKICPVTDEPLDSMGGPVRVEVAGRVVFICCKGCEAALRKNPAKYLAKLPAK